MDRDLTILLVIVAVNLALVSALLWKRLGASGQERGAPRLIAEIWLTFGLAFVLFSSMQRMLGADAATEYGALAGLRHAARQFAALGVEGKAWFMAGGALAVGMLIHLIVAINRACKAPLNSM